jgi:hypothetical protein
MIKNPPFPIRDGYKFCFNCQRELLATTEFWSRCKSKKDGWDTQCKDCRRGYRETHRDEHIAYCLQYAADHREEARLATQEWRENNRERDRENARRWQRNNPERRKQRQDEWKRNNWDWVLEQSRLWKRAHPEITRINYHRRRTRVLGLPSDFTTTDWDYCLEYWGHRCAVCGRPAGLWHTLAREHWIAVTDPRPDNPGTVTHNMLPMCHGAGGCNNSKLNREPTEWLIRRLGKRKAKMKLAEIQAYFDKVRR